MTKPLGSEDAWDDQRAINYLQNFWEPKLGSQMLCSGKKKRISHIEKDFPEQVLLEGDDIVYYIQDLEWSPDLAEVYSVFKTLGIRVHPDSIQYNRIFKNKPSSIIEAAQALVDFRVISISQNNPL